MVNSPSVSDQQSDSSSAAGHRPQKLERRAHLPTLALLSCLFVLSAFSVAVAVSNDRGARRAEASADIAHLSEAALDALAIQEGAADDVIVDNDGEARSGWLAADAATAEAIEVLARTDPDIGSKGAVFEALHVDYAVAAQGMFDRFAGGPEASAEAYEDTEVDQYFDPLAEGLADERNENDEAAHAALSSIRRAQTILVVLTPVLFGGIFAVIGVFLVKLGRSRTRLVQREEENHHQSMHDSLTGLPNRTLLGHRSADALSLAARTRTPMALMIIDLDRFKEINDTLGHHSGDLVLQALALRLQAAVRSTDTVVRLGGDEFAVLLPQVANTATALEVAANIQMALVESFDADGIALDVDASIGIAVSGEHGDDVATLMQHADIAMYRAKGYDLGVCVYDDEQNDHSREQLGLLGELRRGLDNHELVLHFQPKIDLKTGNFCGAEALVRWEHPTRGLISPGSFIPAAERTAMIRPLTRYVIDAALAECQRWKDQGKDLRLAVNVSARNLLDGGFPGDVAALLAKWDLPTSCLVFEVTESAIMLDPERAEAMLRRFADLGVELAIDDFGAGYTSLAHLRSLPVQELKIDQSLVAQMKYSAKDALILRAVIELAHDLGLRTVAEGVEDPTTLDRLTVMGCDIAQGFLIARPMPGPSFFQWCYDRQNGETPLSPISLNQN